MPYAKRNVEYIVSIILKVVYRWISVIKHKKCTEAESVFNNVGNWTITLDALGVLIPITYARGAYGCNKADYDFL